ncbi:MAG TPA: SPOR domain-containing protein [Actinomycetota bacterium]|nr:SPOR domain-containing protein [Actinomycetota bacterium]
MYDTRWPRPGPAMAAVAAVLGLVAGAILGLSSPGSPPTAQASGPPETTVAPTTTTLPEEFETVVLGSFDDRGGAEERLRLVRSQGVKDAGLLDNQQWDLGTRWAVYSGVFQTEDEAEAHMEELSQLGISERYVKSVKQAD